MANRAKSWITSVMGLKCPHCRTGDLFETSTLSFSDSFEMEKRCSVCNQNFFPEPGFYYGAMFVSYIVFAFPCLFFVMFLHWILGLGIVASMVLLCIVAGVGFVYVFRVSRSLWIHMNIRYDQSIGDELARKQA
ncbi:MAG: DUF983 domain-containing protein [Saprospiraceae bacterium]